MEHLPLLISSIGISIIAYFIIKFRREFNEACNLEIRLKLFDMKDKWDYWERKDKYITSVMKKAKTMEAVIKISDEFKSKDRWQIEAEMDRAKYDNMSCEEVVAEHKRVFQEYLKKDN